MSGIREDGFERLCRVLYGREPTALDYSESSNSRTLYDAAEEIQRLRKWVADLQDGMYVNCIYCGHRYPPGTPESRDRALYEHIKTCPKHPLSKALDRIKELEKICGSA